MPIQFQSRALKSSYTCNCSMGTQMQFFGPILNVVDISHEFANMRFFRPNYGRVGPPVYNTILLSKENSSMFQCARCEHSQSCMIMECAHFIRLLKFRECQNSNCNDKIVFIFNHTYYASQAPVLKLNPHSHPTPTLKLQLIEFTHTNDQFPEVAATLKSTTCF